MPPIWSCIMLWPLKNQKKSSLIQFPLVIRMVLGLLWWLKETRFYERKKKRIIKTLRQAAGRQKKLARCFKKWESYISVLKTETNKQKKNNKKTKNNRMFSLAWNIVYWLLKSPCFEFFGDRKYGLFWGKKLMEIWYLLVTEKFLFWAFRWWEIRSFLSFSRMGNTTFWGKKLMKRWNLLITEKFLF